MEWKEITVYTKTEALDILSGHLILHGIRGLMVEDAEDFNEFLEDTTIHWDYIEDELMALKDKETNIKFYLPDNVQGIEQYNEIIKSLPKLREENLHIDMGRLAVETGSVNEEDWSTAWKKYYHPTKIGKKLVVVPCWEDYKLNDGEVKVTLDPGMAFGTGTHETTRLCMGLLEGVVTKETKMLDIGTGSGILAITALLLGAKEAVGVDIDELSVKVAGENAELNGVREKLSLVCGDLTEKISGTFDVLCANIVADVIIRLSQDVTSFMHKGSVLLVSGIIEERADEVRAALIKAGLAIVDEAEENGWVAIKLTLN